MQRREWRLRVQDILDCIARIQRYTLGLTYEQFRVDERTVDAVAYNLEIIGEATGHVPPAVTKTNQQVPWHKMRAMRNQLAHGYFTVNLPVVWDTIVHDLRPLVPLLTALLEQTHDEG